MSFKHVPRRGGLRVFSDAARDVIAAWVVALLIAVAGLALVSFGYFGGSESIKMPRAPHTAGSAMRPSGHIEFNCAGEEDTADQASLVSEPHMEDC